MPSTEPNPSSNREWTRRGLLTAGTAVLGALAGCSSRAGFLDDDEPTPVETGTPTVETRTTEPGAVDDDPGGAGPLRVQISGLLWEAVQLGAGLWNANPSPTADRLVWARLGARPTFDERLADHFAADVGPNHPGGRSQPPFRVATGIGAPRGAATALFEGAADLSGTDDGAGPFEPEFTEYYGDWADAVVRHRLGRDGWVFILSPALAEAGVGPLTADQIRRVFAGDVTTWRALGGPDVAPYVFLGPDVNANWNPAYENFLLAGDTVPTALDARFGRADQLVAAAAERDDALGVLQASGVRVARDRGVPTLDVVVDGNPRSVYDEGYPLLTNDVHLYTLGETDVRERAFLDLLTSPFGQRALVSRAVLPVDPPVGW